MKTNGLEILHIDDDPNDRLLMNVVCREAKISINSEPLDDGNKAIAYLKGAAPYENRETFPLPGVILLDLKMPIKTGFEVLAWMRSQPHLKYIPVIVFTASKQEVDMKRAYDLGANAFVVKPNTMAGLETLIKTIKQFWLTWNEEPSRPF